MKNITITILLVSTLASFAKGKVVESRTANVTVPIEENQKLTLNMKNTELKVEAWDKNEVAIEATVRLHNTMTDKRARFLDNWQSYVERAVSSSSYGVKVSSALEETKEINKKTFLGMVVSVSVNVDKAYDIIYHIKVPAENALEIEGSYEDVSLIGDFKKLELDLYSADFDADNLIDANLELKYGSASIKTIKEANITLYENELEAQQIGSLDLKTKYSEIEIGKIGALELDSYESDFVFDVTSGIEGIIKYGKLEVVTRIKSMDVELYEVDLKLGEVEEVKMRSKYSSLIANAIGTLELESSYEDEFEIDLLGSLESRESKYGDYTIDRLTDSFELEGYEDDVRIDAVERTASDIKLGGKYIETTIELEDVPVFLEINTTYGDFSYDESAMETTKIIKEGSKKQITAKTKGIGETGLKIEVTGYEMDLDLD